jgi:hypothetical protein
MGYISLEDEITRRLPSILIDTESEFYHLCLYRTLTITSGHPEKPSEDDWNYLINEIIEKEPLYKTRILRDHRVSKLYMTDFMFISDYPHKSEESKQAWLDYRQQLRDMTITHPPETFNLDLNTLEPIVTWPVEPHPL